MEKLEGIHKEKEDLRRKTGTVYSKVKGEEVTLEDFNLIKVLGRGAFGKVTLVEKKNTKEYYAIKSLRKEEIIDRD